MFSITEGGDATIIGTEEIAIVEADTVTRFPLDDIADLSSPNIAEGKQKLGFDAVSVETSAKTYRLPTEKGKACFAVWNILLMLSRMQRRDNKRVLSNRLPVAESKLKDD